MLSIMSKVSQGPPTAAFCVWPTSFRKINPGKVNVYLFTVFRNFFYIKLV